MSEEIEALKEAEKEAMGIPRGNVCWRSDWTAGVVLIGLGSLFLLQRLTGFHLHNWWALFLLFPAVGSVGKAWEIYQQHGHWTRKSRQALGGAFFLSSVGVAFLLGISEIWPVILIGLGITVLVSGK
ncbi:MAG: hypothetical protein D6706_06510 [Chloroflexi bacterium]|nr:MAG: hypothetical protein D6706_06510 [Chloroflexota bacterium]